MAEARKIEVTSLLRAVRTGDSAGEPAALALANGFVDDKSPARDRYFVASTMKQMAIEKKGLARFAARATRRHRRLA